MESFLVKYERLVFIQCRLDHCCKIVRQVSNRGCKFGVDVLVIGKVVFRDYTPDLIIVEVNLCLLSKGGCHELHSFMHFSGFVKVLRP